MTNVNSKIFEVPSIVEIKKHSKGKSKKVRISLCSLGEKNTKQMIKDLPKPKTTWEKMQNDMQIKLMNKAIKNFRFVRKQTEAKLQEKSTETKEIFNENFVWIQNP